MLKMTKQKILTEDQLQEKATGRRTIAKEKVGGITLQYTTSDSDNKRYQDGKARIIGQAVREARKNVGEGEILVLMPATNWTFAEDHDRPGAWVLRRAQKFADAHDFNSRMGHLLISGTYDECLAVARAFKNTTAQFEKDSPKRLTVIIEFVKSTNDVFIR